MRKILRLVVEEPLLVFMFAALGLAALVVFYTLACRQFEDGVDVGSGGHVVSVSVSAGGFANPTVTTVTTDTHVFNVHGAPSAQIGEEVRLRRYTCGCNKVRACFSGGCYRY